jgi:hypothetical protein
MSYHPALKKFQPYVIAFPEGALDGQVPSLQANPSALQDRCKLIKLLAEILDILFDGEELDCFDIICTMVSCKSLARALHHRSINRNDDANFKIAERQQPISIAASDSSRNNTALGNLLRPREKRADICTAFQRVFEGFCHDLAQGWDRSSDRFCYGC